MIFSVAALRVTPPVKVLVPAKVKVPAETVMAPEVVAILPLSASVPAPALVILKVSPEIFPPTVKVLALAVIVLSALKVTAPVPRFNALPPVKAKFAFQVCGLLFVRVTLPPVLLSIIAEALPMVKVPATVPKAVALLIFSVAALRVTPPVKVLVPAKVNVPAETVIAPDVVVILPLSTSVPAPALVILKVSPETFPPTVKVLALAVIVLSALKVTVPVPRLSALLPVKAKFAFQL